MRYAQYENPIAVGVLPSTGSVTVEVLHLETGSVLPVATNQASLAAVAGVWTWPLSNINTVLEGYAQLVVKFTHSSGQYDYSKFVVRGVLDEISATRRLVATLV